MKRKQLLTKVMLAVAMLCGSVNAWATTETYSFADWVYAAGSDQKSFAFSASATATINSINCYTITSQLNSHSLNNRFAISNTHTSKGSMDQVWFRLRNSSVTDSYTGLFVADSKYTYLAILDLVVGDKVTITFNNNPDGNLFYTSNATYDVSGTPTAIVSGSTKPVSGTEYTITSDGALGIYLTAYACIKSIVIETSTAETCNAPTMAMTGANGNNRTVTITPGAGSGGSEAAYTIYTTDGSDPTFTSAEVYNGTKGTSVVISENTTVKAISVLSDGTCSEVTSQAFEAGTTIKLAAPTVTLTDMVLVGSVYYPQYTIASNSAGTYGAPTITLTPTFGGSSITSPYTVTAAGTISVTASADGYTTSDATEVVCGGSAYYISDTYDFTDKTWRGSYAVSSSTSSINGSAVYTYGAIATDAITGLTLTASKWGFLASSNSAEVASRSLCSRWGAGTLTYDAYSTGQILKGTGYNGTAYMSSTSSISASQYVELVSLNVYTTLPASVSATIPTSTYGTIASAYALDCANLPTGVTAYKVSSLSASAVTLEAVTEAVAAGTGLILCGTAGETYNIPVVASGTDISASNKLKAAVTATTLTDGTFYILQSGKFCLVTGAVDEAARTVPAGKAYLLASDVPSPARSLSFTFGDEATGISTTLMNKTAMNNEVYNLQGQRVAAPQKGLYIVNGKKVIVK